MNDSIDKRVGYGISSSTNLNRIIVLAGATGHLGQRIAFHLLQAKANVLALVRRDSDPVKMDSLKEMGVRLLKVDFDDHIQLKQALTGAHCVVSALSGLEEVIVDVQSKLLQAAVGAGVPRFIPSDYCIDYTRLPYGSNRNLDLRRRFNELLDRSPIAPTSILNGMFADLLTGQAPVVLFKIGRIAYWGNADQLLDFSTMENTAQYTAHAALDRTTPRYLRIAGDVLNAKGLCNAASTATNSKFKLLKVGNLVMLRAMIRIARFLFPKKKEVFPPWQGMQYLYDMFSGKAKLQSLDNERYPNINWTPVIQVLESKAR